MAVILGNVAYKGFDVLYLMDPKRYRATLWTRKPGHKFYTEHVKTMVDKDIDRLLERVREWIDHNAK